MRRLAESILLPISCVLLVTAAEAQPVANLPLTCSTASAIGQLQNNCGGDWAYLLPNSDHLIVLRGPSSAPTWATVSSLAGNETLAVCSLPVEPGTYSNCRDASGVRRIVYLARNQVFFGAPGALPSSVNILTLEPDRTIEITAPGVYVINRNWVTGPNSGSLLVNADDVTLDLQGFEIRGGVIVSRGRNLLIRNGRVHGATAAIASFGQSAVLQDLRVHVDIGTAIALHGAGSLLHDSTVTVGEGLSVRAGDDTIVRNNRLEGRHAVALEAISSRTLIVDNQFFPCGIGSWCVHIEGDNHIFSRNKITGATGVTGDGVQIVGNHNHAQDNVLSDCGLVPGIAMNVTGQWNTIRGNLVQRCDGDIGWSIGIAFNRDGNFYGDNIVWATTPFAVGATVQTDLGGNVGFSN